MFHGLKPTLLPRAAPDATVSNEMALWLLPFDGKYLGQEVYALSVRQDDGLEAGPLGSVVAWRLAKEWNLGSFHSVNFSDCETGSTCASIPWHCPTVCYYKILQSAKLTDWSKNCLKIVSQPSKSLEHPHFDPPKQHFCAPKHTLPAAGRQRNFGQTCQHFTNI